MLKRIILSIALITPVAGHAAVYQCKVNGQTIFSDQPCGDNAKEIEVKAPALSGGGSMLGDNGAEFLEHRDRKNKVADIDRQIDRLEDQKKRAQRNMDEAFRSFQNKKSRANNNLAGATWEGALADEAEVMRERYQSEIDDVNGEIDRLRDERRRILDQN